MHALRAYRRLFDARRRTSPPDDVASRAPREEDAEEDARARVSA